jgi:glutamate 5-kinase
MQDSSENNVLLSLINEPDDFVHTHFVAGSKKDAVKKWIAYSEGFANAEIIINPGAEQALASEKATSLLLPGVVEFKGEFKKGDLLRIRNEKNDIIGIGRVQYDYDKARKQKGDKKSKPLIHYDYLFLYAKS